MTINLRRGVSQHYCVAYSIDKRYYRYYYYNSIDNHEIIFPNFSGKITNTCNTQQNHNFGTKGTSKSFRSLRIEYLLDNHSAIIIILFLIVQKKKIICCSLFLATDSQFQ